MAQKFTNKSDNSDINNAAFYYSVNMLRTLCILDLLSENECRRIIEISAKHYNVDLYMSESLIVRKYT